MSVSRMRDEVDAEEYEGWRAWFSAGKPGGPRTPETELMDLFMARSLAAQINSNRTSGWPVEVRELMLWPPPITNTEVEARIEAAKAVMRRATGRTGEVK